MYFRRWLLVLICMAPMGGPASAEVEDDADAIADCYLAAMQRKGYGFLSKNELRRRRDQIAAFATKHLVQSLDKSSLDSIQEGIDRCINRHYVKPAGQVDYSNGFGSGGEEWMYLNDRDYFLTFQYHLWFALKRPVLSPADLRRRETQRQWMRQYLTDLPHRGNQETPPRKGMRRDEIRSWALDELEKAFADPMHLLSQPMSAEGFVKLKDRFKKFSNGIAADFHDMEVAALTSRFVSENDPAGRYGYKYPGQIPFDDTVVLLWGNGPSLHFASNAGFRGHYGGLSRPDVYDVIRCDEMRAEPAIVGAEMEAWLAREGRGELTLDDGILRAVRGHKIAQLPVGNWFEADKLTDAQLHTAIRRRGREQISIDALPTMNGEHRGDRSEGEFFIVTENREHRLAVINLHNYEWDQLYLWCRPRAIKPRQ